MPTDKYSNNTGTRRKHFAVRRRGTFVSKKTHSQTMALKFHTHNNRANNGKHSRQAQRMRRAVPWCVHSILFCAYSVETYNWFSTFHLCMQNMWPWCTTRNRITILSIVLVVAFQTKRAPNEHTRRQWHMHRAPHSPRSTAQWLKGKNYRENFPEMLAKRWKNECKYLFTENNLYLVHGITSA